MKPNQDAYGEIINGYETYEAVAEQLRQWQSVAIGWSDGVATHYDILFTLSPVIVGRLQGIHPLAQISSLLFVSILRKGAFAFSVHLDPDKLHPDYVGEKLFVGGSTAARLADLINGVLKALVPVPEVIP